MQITYEKLSLNEENLFHYEEFFQPRFTSPFHLHDEFELILILKSHGKLYIGSSVVNFSDGDLFLFAPGLPHCFFNSRGYENGDELAHAIVIQFKDDFLGPAFFERSEVSHLKKLITRSSFGVQFLNPGNQFREKILEINEKKKLEKLAVFLTLLDILSNTNDIRLLSTDGKLNYYSLNDSKIINNVFRYVAENFQKEVSFDSAASIANMQRSAFCRYFKRKTRKKFTEFVNETRIMHARKLLLETDKSVFEISFECGYQNTSYFNRQFRSHCNISPTAFREQLNNL